MSDKIAEIRARHERDDCLRDGLYPGAHHDRAFLLLELDRLRAENERLFNEDTKTRHALKGWVFVCPDGGDEPTHERVAAVVAEIERLRASLKQFRCSCDPGECVEYGERWASVCEKGEARDVLEGKP